MGYGSTRYIYIYISGLNLNPRYIYIYVCVCVCVYVCRYICITPIYTHSIYEHFSFLLFFVFKAKGITRFKGDYDHFEGSRADLLRNNERKHEAQEKVL